MNDNITFFLVEMDSPLVSLRSTINGHAIYNALLNSKKFAPKELEKVSFGISQPSPLSYKGRNFPISNIDPKEGKTIIHNIEKGYEGFKILRRMQNEITNPLYGYYPIPFKMIRPKHTERVLAHQIDLFTFFIVWESDIPSLDFNRLDFSVGKARNSGFGFARVIDCLHINMEKIVEGSWDKFTAAQGVSGIYNHKKYGFGEFYIDATSNGVKGIKLTTPLCLNSTMDRSTYYGALPSFLKPTEFTKKPYHLWHKGQEHVLDCLDYQGFIEVEDGN